MTKLLDTSWSPFGGSLLVSKVKDAPQKGIIITPDNAQDTALGVVQKASSPASLYFHPGDQVLFHLQGSLDVYLEDAQEDAFIVNPKAVLLHRPLKRKRVEII